jgi:hypothetical protein
MYKLNKKDIIRMVLEASASGDSEELTGDAIERFFHMAQAAAVEQERKEFAVHAIDIARKAIEERDKFWQNHMEPQIEIEVAREREACAKVCEELRFSSFGPSQEAKFQRDLCAKAIRARSGENK